jgi:hypothetical protein
MFLDWKWHRRVSACLVLTLVIIGLLLVARVGPRRLELAAAFGMTILIIVCGVAVYTESARQKLHRSYNRYSSRLNTKPPD